MLMSNSRRSYRELAEKLNLSVTAVHNRIQVLIDVGIIRKFTARPSILAQNAIHILVFGNTKTNSINKIRDKLKDEGAIYWLAVGGGNAIYIGAYIKKIAELEPLVSYIKENAEIPEPTVGITISPVPPEILINTVEVETDLCELDYRIIRILKNDSRKAVADIAEEMKMSAKTIRRRLERMIKNFLIELSIEWYPDASNDIMSVFHVQLKEGAEKNTTYRLWQKYYPETLFYWGFSNIPDNYLFMTWSPTSREVKNLREKLEQDHSVKLVSPNIVFTGYMFNSWRDKF